MGDETQELWLPNSVMRERATVRPAKDLQAVRGFIKARYEYTRSDGRRHYALVNSRDFGRIIDGRACPECLAFWDDYREACPCCSWVRDLDRDIVDQVPQEWLPGPSRTSGEILAS